MDSTVPTAHHDIVTVRRNSARISVQIPWSVSCLVTPKKCLSVNAQKEDLIALMTVRIAEIAGQNVATVR